MLQLIEAGPAIETNTKIAYWCLEIAYWCLEIAYWCLEKALLAQHADSLLRSDTNIRNSSHFEPYL